MPILEGDVQIMLSQVLADVPEGGGAATGEEMSDGVSNNLFPDVSELDRVYGRVSLRKVFPSVRTEDTDTYYGAHVIVADPPNDPAVSVVLFSTGDSFDERTDAASRIEAYLAQGPAYQGLLYGNHIAGQMTLMFIQRVNSVVPAIGTTLCLRKFENLAQEFEQFVRVVGVESNVQTFTDGGGDFDRLVVICDISDQLREDFPGFPASRVDTNLDYTNKTRVYDTVVADAARYYGVQPLTEDITLGDFTAQAEGIFTQLVPSSRAETPITDARMNQQTDAAGAGGAAVTRSLTALFTSTQNLFLGAGILPGSLSIAAAGITLTDSDGLLQNAGVNVGTIDYANGVLALSTNVWGTSGQNFTIIYTPAGPLVGVTESIGIRVTPENQRLTWIATMSPAPQPRTLTVSYMSQGRWYVLSEDGTGGIRGSDSSFGAGNLNYDSGTAAITLGALPDVDSALILTYVPEVSSEAIADADVALGVRFSIPIALPDPIRPGSLSITWNDGSSRTVTDNSNGSLTGYGVGRVFYADGRVYMSPTTLPAVGTELTVTTTPSVAADEEVANFGDGGSTWTTTLDTPIRAGSVEIALIAQTPTRIYPGVDEATEFVARVFDNGSGVLQVRSQGGNLNVGTIDYVTGAVAINKSISGYQSIQGTWANQTAITDAAPRIVYQGQEVRTTALTTLNGPSEPLPNPSWGWWAGEMDSAAFIRYSSSDGTGGTYEVTVSEIVLMSAVDITDAPQPLIRMR